MFGTDEERDAMQKGCQRQAEEILAQHWKAVEDLAAQLRAHGWLPGKEAHRIICQALGEERGDWRRNAGRLMSKR